MDYSWLEISIDTTSQAMDDLSAYLTGAGITGLVLDDEADFQDFLENNHEYWDYVDEDLLKEKEGVSRITFYLPQTEDGRARLSEITAGLEGFRGRCSQDPGTLEVHTKTVQEEDWAENWKQYYKPLDVGKNLRIIPEWMKDEAVPEGKIPIYLNPGLTFGTGEHASTQLCLESLEDIVRPGDAVLDLGCGSGILSIAALRLGAEKAAGCDIDPKAADVAMENAGYNGITGESLKIYSGNILSDAGLRRKLSGQYDIVLANIVADVIIPLSAFVKEFMAPGGYFLCSGIIDFRAQETRTALEQNGLTVLSHNSRSDWHSFLCRV